MRRGRPRDPWRPVPKVGPHAHPPWSLRGSSPGDRADSKAAPTSGQGIRRVAGDESNLRRRIGAIHRVLPGQAIQASVDLCSGLDDQGIPFSPCEDLFDEGIDFRAPSQCRDSTLPESLGASARHDAPSRGTTSSGSYEHGGCAKSQGGRHRRDDAHSMAPAQPGREHAE